MRLLDGITNSMDMSLSKLWELVNTGKAGLLQSMGSQRVGHDFHFTCNEYSGLVSFGIDWFDLLAVQGTLKSLL